MSEDDEKSRQNMIVAAEFMARMIQKYGKKVLEEFGIDLVSVEEFIDS